MNLTDKNSSKISEAGVAISHEQTRPDIADANAGMSESGMVELQVIARIPDLDTPSSPQKHKHSSRSRTTKSGSSSGRVLSAGLSLKLLVGLGLVLLLGAIAPYVVVNFKENTQSRTGDAMEQAWQPPPPAPTADLAPAWKPPALEPKAIPIPAASGADATLVADVKAAAGKETGINASPQPGKTDLEPIALAQSSSWPRDNYEKAEFSPWPNPAHPIFAEADLRRNESITADRRNASLSGGAVKMPLAPPPQTSGPAQSSSENEAGTAQFEGMINTPSDRNSYDRTRSSIH